MPRKYSKVENHTWRDEDFYPLPRLTKLLWLHLLTSPMQTNIPGLIPASLTIIADEMGEKLNAEFNQSVDALIELGWAKVDPAARVILLPKAAAHNLPESPNVVTGWATRFDEIPNSPLKDEWLKLFAALVEANPGKDNTRLEALQKGFGKALERLTDRLPDPSSFPFTDPNIKPQHAPARDHIDPGEGFDAFWSEWPRERRTGKAAAFKAWKATVKKRPATGVILDAVRAQKKGQLGVEPKFIPHPERWIRGLRWNDPVVKQETGHTVVRPQPAEFPPDPIDDTPAATAEEIAEITGSGGVAAIEARKAEREKQQLTGVGEKGGDDEG